MLIRFYANMRTIMGMDFLEISNLGENSTLRDVFKLIMDKYPSGQPRLVNAAGELFSDVPIFLNGRNPRLMPSWLDTLIKPGDVISMFSPIASGKLNVEVMRNSTQQ